VLQTGAAGRLGVSVSRRLEYEQANPGAVILATQEPSAASYDYVGDDRGTGEQGEGGGIDDFTARLNQGRELVRRPTTTPT